MSSILSRNAALRGLLDQHLAALSQEEGLAPETITSAIEAGSMVLLGNPAHAGLAPIVVGQPSRIKVNANIGTSPLCNCLHTEKRKLAVALEAGADTVMDLSIAGDLDAIRTGMLAACPRPLGTVPMYSVGQQILDNDRDIASMQPDDLFAEIEKQARQGVDFMTVHCGLTKRGAEMAVKQDRVMGVVSRGGSMLARWMLENGKENPLLEYFDRLIDVCRQFNVTLSLGDGLRPGAGVDAGDAAQWEEVITLGRLAKYALEQGVQCMIEGPGHVPMNQVRTQIQGIKRLTNNAPLYVLGPLCCDSAPGYDHIAGAIGGALGVEAGVDFLCYLTPAEHLTLPNEEDVRAGVMASRVAAHVGEVALGRERAVRREATMNAGRKALDWDMMREAALDPQQLDKRREDHKHEDVCAMCGKFCAVKMLKDQKKD
ncbi:MULTISPECIES: phosphomethylpyrimidine synthase ThiC [Desulfovibrio]|jgi:phosphomethylpyrimidine synthase|uniref:Phosphomethylpyrimidine synthase n=2 Tax=Desulfovibrio piger TaxID=901 RepID=A0A848CBQ5_9BACT|nr:MULTISPECIES: phosphomethylpyrimidine synthase ThiC [Desulfovibrio]MCI6333181.1 phosphomethylpyrimidine synthase ThiC [Desulfovibrio piger]MCI7373400.1 phosphomethylpyrimidine synthase ThiC [Desulfovibrio piger]MCI7405924.1 phosphomethylpyrimidine synthase ThiC [Desulfovibrio piger]MDD6248875.1 phosphomethylpyrimidine synthase ThiC [Desulfovibrio piger]MDM8330939.1 phosphomethylpyrimidine synthase ThiC [Desulfovibrio piger]